MSFILLNSSNYFHNLDQISNKVGKDKIAVVLKDNAYGHGLIEMATLANKYGITKAVVRFHQEALMIAPMFEMVLMLGETITFALPSNIHGTINTLEDIEKTLPNSLVHLKIDTGMHRNGIAPHELGLALEKIKKHSLVLKGVFSHLRGSDELSSTMFWQTKNFQSLVDQVTTFCTTHHLDLPLFHLHNSSGIFKLNSSTPYDMVRSGIATYGYALLDAPHEQPPLLPVLSLWGEKVSTRTLKKGECVGYNGAFCAPCDMIVSTYDIGYGDGLFRQNGEDNPHLVCGRAVLGKVSMDLIIVEGDDEEIEIFNDAQTLSDNKKTIVYETMTRLSPTIKRVISPNTKGLK